MQFSNSFIYNNYTLLLKVIRLTFLAICFLFCLMLISCKFSAETDQKIGKKSIKTVENAININLAPTEELEKLPKIGSEIAKRIIEHREKYGKFRKAEHLILVRGMSDKKFRELQNLVKIE